MKRMQTFISRLTSVWKMEKKPKSPLFGADYKQAMLIKLGREQFKWLMKKGLGVPVALL